VKAREKGLHPEGVGKADEIGDLCDIYPHHDKGERDVGSGPVACPVKVDVIADVGEEDVKATACQLEKGSVAGSVKGNVKTDRGAELCEPHRDVAG
jgi:hypothetical protein